MLYDRKIKYLDYYEGGTKVNGGGFVKLEVRDNILRLELTIRGLRPTDSFERDIVLQGAEKEGTLGKIHIQNGCGQFRYSCDVDQEIGATGISYSELQGIRISIGGTREILCHWDNVSDKRRITPSEENSQKSTPGFQEAERETIAESPTGIKADFETPVYTESEQNRQPKLEKAEEIRRDEGKEDSGGIKDKDRENSNRQNRNREQNIVESNDRENREENIIESSDRENKNNEESIVESRERENKNRGENIVEGNDRENKNREENNLEGRNRENKNKDVNIIEGSEREDYNREGKKEVNKNSEDKDREREENKQNKKGNEDIKNEVENRKSVEKDNEGLKAKEKDMKSDTRPGTTEMQAQGATMLSDVMSSQFAEGVSKAGIQPEERSGDRTKDKSDMTENNPVEQPDARKAPVKLMEDKWQQLSTIYPHIQPFRDERDYLSLTPSDFVLFPDRFYRAVNNSFLLHGYYNYHHLILARIERRGEILYYIGVPGNYFEREKQVAIMFGFESFECETEPAETGDFGYYMMRTEL